MALFIWSLEKEGKLTWSCKGYKVCSIARFYYQLADYLSRHDETGWAERQGFLHSIQYHIVRMTVPDKARGLFSQPLLIYTLEISRCRATLSCSGSQVWIHIYKMKSLKNVWHELGGIWPVLFSKPDWSYWVCRCFLNSKWELESLHQLCTFYFPGGVMVHWVGWVNNWLSWKHTGCFCWRKSLWHSFWCESDY